ncbi:MAG: peptidylprolyl isomerase [Melioribacteraceae bacterium]|nr:peptidylprolyl isomerase [Melioribacteraceae bacterium]
MQKVVFVVLVSALFSFKAIAQNSKVLAEVGDIKITTQEFLKRYELTPHADKKKDISNPDMKKDFLFTLIAEKLIAKEALKNRIDTLKEFKSIEDYIKNIYLRDALYNKEVKEKVIISQSEWEVGKKRISQYLKMKFIFSTSEAEIDSLFHLLKSGASFDSLLSLRDENNEQLIPAEVTFGKMHPEIENEIYKLKKDEFTKPIKLKEGFYICKLYDKTITSDLTDSEKSSIRSVIQTRKEDSLYQEFYEKFFKDIVVNVDTKIFVSLADKIKVQYSKKKETELGKESERKFLLEKDFFEILNSFSKDELKKVFVKFPTNPISLESFIYFLIMENFDVYSIDIVSIRGKLNYIVQNYIQNKLLEREAVKRGYLELPEIKSDIDSWKTFYLSQRYKTQLYKNQDVSREEALTFFNKSNHTFEKPLQYRISEIYSKDLLKIEAALKDLESGKDFGEVAFTYHDIDSIRNKKGDIGYISALENNEYSQAISSMKKGDYIGPIPFNEGYSIIKFSDSKKEELSSPVNFEEAESDIKGILKSNKLYDRLKNDVADFASKKGVKINIKELTELKITEINMVVFRRFGFGGQMLAVPYTPIFSNWYEVYEKQNSKNPL